MIFDKDGVVKIVSIIICTKVMLDYPQDKNVGIGDKLGLLFYNE